MNSVVWCLFQDHSSMFRRLHNAFLTRLNIFDWMCNRGSTRSPEESWTTTRHKPHPPAVRRMWHCPAWQHQTWRSTNIQAQSQPMETFRWSLCNPPWIFKPNHFLHFQEVFLRDCPEDGTLICQVLASFPACVEWGQQRVEELVLQDDRWNHLPCGNRESVPHVPKRWRLIQVPWNIRGAAQAWWWWPRKVGGWEDWTV